MTDFPVRPNRGTLFPLSYTSWFFNEDDHFAEVAHKDLADER